MGGRAGALWTVPIRSPGWLARVIAGHGPDALVLAPAELREAVTQRLASTLTSDDPTTVAR